MAKQQICTWLSLFTAAWDAAAGGTLGRGRITLMVVFAKSLLQFLLAGDALYGKNSLNFRLM